ncbi:ribosome assembly RNA-binding protein YhbY [Thiomicrospira sp. R3]|uniref:ribosome assembly RNA-binding protein YhbY n=1 Tax=Thiomicrospira sp. R3 TaxID=3035472 RepID=UPI00259AEDBD|nr:ribosome assembly RNA-binding protein YhbY [Thiomicrospira sp. R3]WFE68066.1 ribosome assembly RNA-binding protein YhbY [Thiomicrospira sp. R3]
MKATNSITNNQKKFLRGIAHGLSPMIIIGSQGITDNLMAELEKTLKHHEILKVKIAAGEREDRKEVIDFIIKATRAQLVHSVGKMFVIYRARAKDPQLELPKN